jgi:hypothetical protein
MIGILEWGGPQILPLVRCPPYYLAIYIQRATILASTRPGYPDENWRTVPYDWTCFDDLPSGQRLTNPRLSLALEQ